MRIKTRELHASDISLYNTCKRCFWDAAYVGHKPKPSTKFRDAIKDSLVRRLDKIRINKKLPYTLRTTGIEPYYPVDISRFRNSGGELRWSDEQTGFTLSDAVDEIVLRDKQIAPFIIRLYNAVPENTRPYDKNKLKVCSFLLRRSETFRNESDEKFADSGYIMYYSPGTCKTDWSVISFRLWIQQVELGDKETVDRRVEFAFRKAAECLIGDRPEPSRTCWWCKPEYS